MKKIFFLISLFLLQSSYLRNDSYFGLYTNKAKNTINSISKYMNYGIKYLIKESKLEKPTRVRSKNNFKKTIFAFINITAVLCNNDQRYLSQQGEVDLYNNDQRYLSQQGEVDLYDSDQRYLSQQGEVDLYDND